MMPALATVVVVDNYTVAPTAATPDMYTPVSDTWPHYLETVGQKNRARLFGGRRSRCAQELVLSRSRLWVPRPGDRPATCHPLCGARVSRQSISGRYYPPLSAGSGTLPGQSARFLPDGGPPHPGQKLVCGDYAQTLQCIAQEGADALYNGALGDMVVRDIETNGGILTREDLQSYRIIRREAVRGNYRGHEIVTVGPPSAGGVHIIQMLNILEQFDMAALGFGTAASVHVLAEALKIAFADRFEYLGDPAFMEIPVRGLISKFYAVARRRQINLQSAQRALMPATPGRIGVPPGIPRT